ncbi:MAG TPA: MscL family protein [Candidatus Saccharimonadales bacterium]|nr:MscL family protein [Candidatus Saccharimonadales bacterium]
MTEQAKKRTAAARAKASALKGKSVHFAAGFGDFIRTQGVIGLAVGLVLGGAVTVVVKSLVDNIIMPPLGLFLGSSNGLKGLTLNLGKTDAGKEAVLYYGTFLNDVVNFLVIALTIYLVVHALRLDRLDKKKG